MSMLKGIVTRWIDNKGFGFALDEEGNTVFVHESVIRMDGWRCLAPDDEIIFERKKTERGYSAYNVRRIADLVAEDQEVEENNGSIITG